MNDRHQSAELSINTVEDIVRVRRFVRNFACDMGFGLSDQTRIATAVSELARNCIQYAKMGVGTISDESTDSFSILRVCICDSGNGIADISKAMLDGFSTGNGLGAGLPGCKRLMDFFEIESDSERGTRVMVEIHESK